MVGTPPMLVRRSALISSSALVASKWCIMTILAPAAALTTITARQPVAWKSGMLSRLAVGTPASSSLAPANLSVLRCPMKNRFIRLVITLRCEPTAPLGLPVVPDV